MGRNPYVERAAEDMMMATGVPPHEAGSRRVAEMVLAEFERGLREATMKFQVGGQVMMVDVHRWMEEVSPIDRDLIERRVTGTAVVAQIARVGEREWLGVVPGLAIRESGDSADQVAAQVQQEIRQVRQMGSDELCRIYFHWAYTSVEVDHVRDYYDLVEGVHVDYDEATHPVVDQDD